MTDTQIAKNKPVPFRSEPEMVDKMPEQTYRAYMVYPRRSVIKTWFGVMKAPHVTLRGKWVSTKWTVKRLLNPATESSF